MDVDALDRATVAKLAREREIRCAGQLGACLIGGVLALAVALTLPDTRAAKDAAGMAWALPGVFLLLAAAYGVARLGWRRVGVLVAGRPAPRALSRVSARTSSLTIWLYLLGLVVLLPSGPTAAVLALGDGSWWRIMLATVVLGIAGFGLAGARSLVLDVSQARQGPPARG